MRLAIQEIKNITVEDAVKLNGHGIRTSDQLLDAACTPDAREALAKRLGINVRTILEYANRADLARLKGVGSVYSDLLEEAGVDTVRELSVRAPDTLHLRLVEVIAAKQMRIRPPGIGSIKHWIAQSKKLRPLLHY